MRPTQRVAKTGALVLVVAGLGGAVLHSLPEPADHVVRPTVGRDLDTWAMPLDGYACQQSSGYRRTLYDAQWSRLLHVTATDAAVLESVEPDQADVAERIASTIDRLAPAAPKGVD